MKTNHSLKLNPHYNTKGGTDNRYVVSLSLWLWKSMQCRMRNPLMPHLASLVQTIALTFEWRQATAQQNLWKGASAQ